MAEVVEEMQERLLPEYEQMRRFEIFSEEQVRDMIERRLKLQSKITKSSKCVRDYLDFIIYERKVHRLITEKEVAHGSKLTGLKSSIVKRIIKLYREALSAFPYEEKLWQNFIQFSKKSVPFEVAGIYEKLLTLHGDKPNYWSEAAIWCYQQTGKITKPKSILYRALDRHPQAEVLHKALFDLLLKSALNMSAKRNLQDNTISEQEFGLQYLQIAYEHSKQHLTNVDYFLSILRRCEDSPETYLLTVQIQKRIIDDLIEHFSTDPKLWDALAQRELNGYHLNDIKKYVADCDKAADASIKVEQKAKHLHSRPLKERIELSYKVYKDAVSALKSCQMFEYFINAMLSLNEDTSSFAELRLNCLMTALDMALAAGLINDDHLQIYVSLSMKSEESPKMLKTLFERLSSEKTSLTFYSYWLECLPSFCEDVSEQQECVLSLYRQAKKMLAAQDFVEIVQLVIEFYRHLKVDDKTNDKYLAQIFQDICMSSAKEMGVFRAEYLESVYESTGSIGVARKKFKELSQLAPPCVKLYQTMAKIESEQSPADVRRWRLLLEEATSLFGDTESDLWLEFLQFERNYGSAENMTLLYTRAMSRLKSEFLEDFTKKFTLLSSFSCLF